MHNDSVEKDIDVNEHERLSTWIQIKVK